MILGKDVREQWSVAGTGFDRKEASHLRSKQVTLTIGCILQTSRDVLRRKVREISQDFFPRHARGKIFEHIINSDAHTANTWLATAFARLDRNDVLIAHDCLQLLLSSPNIIAVHPFLPARSIKELIALAKAKPGALNYSSGQTGASSHLAGELFNAIAGVRIVRIPFKGQGPAMLSLVTGEAQLSFANAASAMPYVQSGKIRGLAVTTAQPSALALGLPTVAASGLPGYESKAMLGMFAPARTPSPVIEQLNSQIVRTLNSSDVKQRLFDSGAEVIAGSPPELAAAMKSEMATTGKLIRQVGIRAD